MTEHAMHEYTSPSPGKTAPRLIEDLLDYDARWPHLKKYHVLADPAPQYLEQLGKPATLRKAVKDCRHDLLLKSEQSGPYLSKDKEPDFTNPHVVATYCSKCRYHFTITVGHTKGGNVVREPCRLKTPNPLHHFRYVANKSQRAQQPDATSKYDGHIEQHYFKCSNTKCPAYTIIKITPPRFSKEFAKILADPAKIETRRRAAIQHAVDIGKPDRYDNIVFSQADVYSVVLQYLRDALVQKPGENKRIAKENKNFMLVCGQDCVEMLKYLDFTESEDEVEGEPLAYWNLPCIPQGVKEKYNFLQDVSLELGSRILKLQSAGEGTSRAFEYSPLPALKQIERCLGCCKYSWLSREFTTFSKESLEHPHYASLGAREDFSDELIQYSYIKQKMCDEPNKPYYLDCLAGIAQGRNSVDLETEAQREASCGELRYSSIVEAYKFFRLDPKTSEGDDHIIGIYRSWIDDAPLQKDKARDCLKVIAKSRKSNRLEAIADDKSLTSKEAYDFLGAPPDAEAGMIDSVATVKASEGHRLQVVKALRVIANTRRDPFLHTSATRIELEGEDDSIMDVPQAYRTLQITDRSISDQNAFVYYQSLMGEAPGSKDSLQKALKSIARDRKSDYLLAKLDDANASVETAVSTAEHPVGLRNIGNTCYLNSLLQFCYTVKPIRDIAMNFEDYRDNLPEGEVTKRVGGQLIQRSEIIKAQQFVEELGKLFMNMKTASTADIKPSQRLAELALISSKVEDDFQRASVTSPQAKFLKDSLPIADTSAMPPAPTRPTPSIPESVDVDMSDQPPSYDEVDASSEATLVNSDHVQTPSINCELGLDATDTKNGKDTLVVEEQPPGYTPLIDLEDIEEAQVLDGIDPNADAIMLDIPDEQDLGLDKQLPEKPPPIPPRTKPEAIDTSSANEKSLSAQKLIFGLQQDVTEVMQNVLYLISCAIKPKSLDALNNDQQIDQIRSTFFGQTAEYIEGEHAATSDWNSLTAFPSASNETRSSIYEALDSNFDETPFEARGKDNAMGYKAIKKLPPILQIMIQRAQYDKTTGQQTKNYNWISVDQTIYLDRYLDCGADEPLMGRRRTAWKLKDQLRTLQNRRDVLAKETTSITSSSSVKVPEVLSMTSDAYKILQEQEIEGVSINPRIIDDLGTRSEELETEARDLDKKISKLRKDLDDQFMDLRKHKYTLQAVFIHRGSGVGFGHYWVYIYDFAAQRWRIYNDEYVQVVEDTSKIFSPDTSGGRATPYYLVYVRDDQKDEIVDAVCRDVRAPTTVLPNPNNYVKLSPASGTVQQDEAICIDDDDMSTSHIEHAPLNKTMNLNEQGW